ncbi:PAS domain S-box protein, partial [Pontiella sp.]|uniref:PAS domain S-box protein n=1 Tax=Pontiella sp. TaxID=2837462 RepID=UPI0035640AC4
TRPDGTRCWLSTSKVPIRDAEGRVIGVLGAYQDITDKKELEEERIRLTTAIGQSAEAIVIMDIDGRIQYVNPAFESITGYTPGEAVGQTLALIKSGSRDAEFFSKIWKRLESGGSWEGRTENLRKNGSVYTAELAISPVKNPEGTMENYVAALRDVSRQVELEAHIRQAQKMDAVGRLAGGVAHDFNNILQSILGFSGILMGELETGTTQYEDVSEIRNAARRAGDLTRQLLTLSRKHDVEYAALDLNVIIRSNEAMLRRLIGEKIEFSFELEPELKRIRADSSQIEQILLNLFINARDAMPGGGRLKVKTSNVKPTDETPETVAGNGEQICLEVSDTGHGIREDVRAHLFEPFFTTKQVGEGTGLGLSVVYGIVQQHRGHIDVSSTVEEGSVFSVYLPVSGEDIVLQSGEEPEGQNERSVEGNGEEILVVEDDTVLRELSHRMLKDAGYSVESTASLKDAVEQEQQKMPDLVMADMVLPDGSGLDFARNLRERAPKLAVLLCSGYAHEQDIHEEIQQLGFRYLEKPIGSMQLLQTVREMLDELREV